MIIYYDIIEAVTVVWFQTFGRYTLMLPHLYISQKFIPPLKDQICRPILASVARNQLAGLMVAGASVLQIGLVRLGLPGWQCPLLHILGVPCPGCGLSRAIVALLQGDWRTSFELHAFAPIVVGGLLLIAWSVILPKKQRTWFLAHLEVVERRTGITAILLISLMIYWLIRLLVFPDAFINLVKG